MSTLLILRSWNIAWLHLSSRCFLLMRSAEGCIVGLASVRPNFLGLTFDPRAEGASLSLSRSCHVSPAAEETSSGGVETHAISTAPAALVFQEVTSAQRAAVGCHLFVIRVTTSDLWPPSRRVEYWWRDGKGSAGHLRFRRRQAAAQSCCSQSSLSSHIFCLNRFISVLSCSRGGFLSEGVFMFDFIVHEVSAALKFLWFSSAPNMLTPCELFLIDHCSLFFC